MLTGFEIVSDRNKFRKSGSDYFSVYCSFVIDTKKDLPVSRKKLFRSRNERSLFLTW